MEYAVAQIFDPGSFSGLLLTIVTALSLTSVFVVLGAFSISVVQGIWEDLRADETWKPAAPTPTPLYAVRKRLATA